MTHWIVLCLALLSVPAFAQPVPVIRYESVPNAVRLPQGMYFGEVAGVAAFGVRPGWQVHSGDRP